MKKLIGVVLALTLTVLGFGFTQHNQEVEAQQLEAFNKEYYAPTYDIVEENGFQVIKDNDPKRSTIVVEVTTGDVDGDGYVLATNVFDSEDNISIDKEDFKIGDRVLVTFHGDLVEKMVKE